MEEHLLKVKIYLEDTDAEGIVYYANYLKYIERSRSDMFEQLGLSMVDATASGRSFVVHELHMKYIKPARLGDKLVVKSTAKRESDFRVSFHQEVYLEEKETLLVVAQVQVVCVDNKGNLVELPASIRFDFLH